MVQEPYAKEEVRAALESFRWSTQKYCVARRTPLDEVDRKLLTLLQQDADRSLADLGNRVNLSPSAVQRRIVRLRASRAIARHVAVLNDDVLPGMIRACVLVSLERESAKLHGGFRERVRAAPEAQQCYDVSGAWDYLVVLIAAGMPACRAAIDRLFLGAPNVKRYETLFVLETIKLGIEVPLAQPSRRALRKKGSDPSQD